MTLDELTALVRQAREKAEAHEAAREELLHEELRAEVAEVTRKRGRNQHTTRADRVNPFKNTRRPT